MLKISNLNYKIDDFELKIDHLIIKDNSIHTIVGQSGSGKSTLINLIAGHIQANSGNIYLNDKNLLTIRPHNRKVGLIFQKALLFPNMNVYENIAYPLRVEKKPESEIKATVNNLLDKVNLTGLGKRMPDQLSGGQQKRVAIARTLAIHPDILLMDEPLNSLDPKLKNEIIDMILSIQKQSNLSILFITHDFEEALKISDEISVIENGKIIHSGSRHDLLFNPKNEKIVDFFPFFNKENISINSNTFNIYNKKIKTDKINAKTCVVPPQSINILPGNEGKIVNHFHLKYGNIYEIKTKEHKFYAFSKKEYTIDEQVGYSIDDRSIILLGGEDNA